MRLAAFVLGMVVLLACAGCRRECSAREWDGQTGFTCCRGAIKGYPERAVPSCGLLNMCANEARLSSSERRRLELIMKAKGCTPP